MAKNSIAWNQEINDFDFDNLLIETTSLLNQVGAKANDKESEIY